MGRPHHDRKPAHLEMIGGRSNRQRIWEAIRANRDNFTAVCIIFHSGVDDTTVQTYLLALCKAGYVESTNEAGMAEVKEYRLIRDNGLEAPRLTSQGKLVVQGLAQEQMWRTMRMLGSDFNYLELARMASTSETMVSTEAAKSYLKHLAHAGYVTVTAKGRGRGAGGVPSRYRFNPGRYTGPRPPMVQRTKNVYDPNLGKVVWQQEVDHDEL